MHTEPAWPQQLCSATTQLGLHTEPHRISLGMLGGLSEPCDFSAVFEAQLLLRGITKSDFPVSWKPQSSEMLGAD